MNRRISFVYSRALTKEAVKSFWLRHDGRFYTFWIATILFALTAFLMSTNTEQFSQAEIFGLGILVGALGVFVFQITNSHGSIERTISLFSKKMNGIEFVYTFDPQGISVEYADNSANFSWKFIDRLWIKSNIWILWSDWNVNFSFLLPASLLDADLQQFITERITESGGKVE
ncbi:MAG: hypothetical protein SFY66_19465 [Oculatellaceae cyanobacterium bins.114]|nr:hypothetical protein [Oculatellaceae cyanobacterium bins.114]